MSPHLWTDSHSIFVWREERLPVEQVQGLCTRVEEQAFSEMEVNLHR